MNPQIAGEFIAGRRVQVYFNLHRKTFSIRDARTKRVVGYADNIMLHDVLFIVNQSGRDRVLRERKKNVHAYCEGTFVCYYTPSDTSSNVQYNPYLHKTFVNPLSGKPVSAADTVFLKVVKQSPKLEAINPYDATNHPS
jgi:hypothetical protein